MIDYENLKKVNEPFREEMIRDFMESFDSGWYILGKKVKQFEEEFAAWCGNKYCVGVANGLDALTLSLRALEFEPGTEIIVPSNTYIATILSIVQNGLTPVLVEPDLRTYNIDPEKIEEKITSRTRAIMVVHLYGRVCEMDRITEIQKKYDLKLIEDCAQSHGAKFKGRNAGTFGDYGCFSFYPTKNLGALGDAGSVNTNDEALAEKIRTIRNYGSRVKYFNEKIGFNSRLDEIQAGFLLIKLRKLDEINSHKRKLAELYFSGLKDDFIKPVKDNDHFDVYHIFNVRHPKRDNLKEYLLKNHVKTEIHYPLAPNRQEAMKKIFAGVETPVAEEIHNTTLSLPISFAHNENEISRVIELMNKF